MGIHSNHCSADDFEQKSLHCTLPHHTCTRNAYFMFIFALWKSILIQLSNFFHYLYTKQEERNFPEGFILQYEDYQWEISPTQKKEGITCEHKNPEAFHENCSYETIATDCFSSTDMNYTKGFPPLSACLTLHSWTAIPWGSGYSGCLRKSKRNTIQWDYYPLSARLSGIMLGLIVTRTYSVASLSTPVLWDIIYAFTNRI